MRSLAWWRGHAAFTYASLACEQAIPEVCKIPLTGLNALANLLGSSLAFNEIRFYVLPMP
jgi:hypothetical protein